MQRRFALTAVALVFVASNTPAQVQQAGAAAGTYAMANVAPAAREAFLGAMDAYNTWSFGTAQERLHAALAADSTSAVIRQFRNSWAAPSTVAAGTGEYNRAIRDARTVQELTYVSALRAGGINGNRLYGTLREMFPNDRRIALEHAITFLGDQRVDSLRAMSRRHPDYVGAKIWLAYYLTLTPFATSRADLYEALNVAMDAVRLAPQTAGTHTALGHVLQAMGRTDEAVAHLNAATKMDRNQEYAWVLLSEIYADDGKPQRVDRARAALDSAMAVNQHAGRRNTQRVNRAFLLFYDGRSTEGMAELLQVARDLEAAGAVPAVLYSQMAGLAAATGDSASVGRWLAEARRVGPNTNISVQSAQAYALNRQPAEARRAIADYLRTADTTTLAYRYDITRLNGMALLAEGKPAEALVELKKSDVYANTFAQLAMVEAYTQLKDQKSADATLAELVARKDIGNAAISKALAHHRMAKSTGGRRR